MLRYGCIALKRLIMSPNSTRYPLLVVLGATGTGKSKLAVDLAERFNGEIINGDAVQMYDGLPIITNKVTVEEQQGIPHHLLGFIALDEEPWRVGMFKEKAGQIIREIRSRGKLPIIVGGTHYYTQSLLFEDTLLSKDDDGATSELSNEEIAEKFPILEGCTETILERLREVDPVMADRWHPKDRRKIRRSLEIYLLTGKTASTTYAEQKSRKLSRRSHVDEQDMLRPLGHSNSPLLFWVHAERDILKKRLNTRVENMMQAGLLDEVRSMSDFVQKQGKAGRTVDQTRGIWVSIGWKEFEPFLRALETGKAAPEEIHTLYQQCIEQTQAATRQYAKRQIQWIRLKLMPALADENLSERLYLLDGSDVTQFTDAVSNPALDITAKFLDGAAMQTPKELSTVAYEMLDLETEPVKVHDSGFRQECDICHMTALDISQWQAHLKSRRHRGLVKKLQKMQKVAASGRFLNQKDDNISESDTVGPFDYGHLETEAHGPEQ